jgi:hypothetical protein
MCSSVTIISEIMESGDERLRHPMNCFCGIHETDLHKTKIERGG